MLKTPKYIAVYGLGYVGLTLYAAWLRAGYKVMGVDVLENKIKASALESVKVRFKHSSLIGGIVCAITA